MNAYFAAKNSAQVKSRCNAQMLLLFLTGIILGCVFVRYFDISGVVFSNILNQDGLSGFLWADFLETVLSMSKFLLLLYLLSFQRWGAMMVPPVFGVEGICLGISVCSLVSASGRGGIFLAVLLLMFRLILILPFGFLLGGWSVEQSLRFPNVDIPACIKILAVTLTVICIAAFLECSLARWLGGIYYLKFGV